MNITACGPAPTNRPFEPNSGSPDPISKIWVEATESKTLAGIKDVAYGVMSVIGAIVRKIQHIAAKIFGCCKTADAELNQDSISADGLESEFTIDGKKFTESARVLDTDLAKAYLEQMGQTEEAQYINDSQGNIRPSSSRKKPNAQGMITNGWSHALLNDQNETIDTEFRSGAFAVHDKKIAEDKRLTLGVAQALPKVVASIKQIINNPESQERLRSADRILHAETSLLSDEFKDDRHMIKQMENVLDHLRKNLRIQCSKKAEESITVEDSKITVTLPSDELDGKEFGVDALFFTQGVNEWQSLGHIYNHFPGTPLQDEINEKNLNLLLQYARDSQNAQDSQALKNLKSHYSQESQRKAKDLEGLQLIREAVTSLGGGHGTVCKSGKDRTGMQVSLSLASSAAKKTGFDQKEAFEQLIQGVSYKITGLNTGKEPSYAFNAYQRPQLPWNVPARLCGSVES